MSASSLAWSLPQELLAARRGVLATLPAQSGACIHNWTSREPVFAAGKEEILVQCIRKGLMLPAYLLSSLALRSDGVLYLTRQMKEIDLGVDSSEVSNGTRTTREEVNT